MNKEYNGWNLFDKVLIVVNSVGQGYIVDPKNKKSLQSAKEWGRSNIVVTDENGEIVRDKKGYAVTKEFEPEVVETDNCGFKVSLYDSANNSYQGGKQSFWNCKIEKDGREYIIGINADLLLDLLKQSDFKHGVCKEEVLFARKNGRVGLLHKGMQQYKDAVNDKQLKKDLSKKKTSKWQIGKSYDTVTQSDMYLGKVYEPIKIENDLVSSDKLPEDVYKKIIEIQGKRNRFYSYGYINEYTINIDKYRQEHIITNTIDIERLFEDKDVDRSLNQLIKICTDNFDSNADRIKKCTGNESWYSRELVQSYDIPYQKNKLSGKLPARQQGNIEISVNNNYEQELNEMFKHFRTLCLALIKKHPISVSIKDIDILLRSTDGIINDQYIDIVNQVFDKVELLRINSDDKFVIKIINGDYEEYFYTKESARDKIVEILKE